MALRKTQLAINVRRAQLKDAGVIAALDAKVQRERGAGHGAELLAECRRKNGVALIAEVNGRVAGYLLGEVRAWEFGSPPTGWVYAVAVDPRAQGVAVGRHLVEAALAQFAARGAEAVRTMVQRERVDLLRFFRSLGFRAGPFVELEASLGGA